MNKTVNINLGGIFFHIDEDAYQKLKMYLDAVRNSLSDDPQGKDEIINDIEIRISEILSEKIKDSRQVVNVKDVEKVIEIMGKPEDYAVDFDYFSDDFSYESKKINRKKLYRDPDDKFLGGVCSGLAHYFNVDVIWVRLFWLFFALTYGSGVLIYFLLWILLPVANTTSEKLEMEGEEVNINNIEKKIREEFKEVSNRFKEGVDDLTNEIKKGNYETKLKNAIQEIIGVLTKVFNVFFKSFGKILGVIILLFSGLILFSLIVSIFSIGSIEFLHIDTDIVQYPPFFFNASIPKGILGVALALLLGIPFFFLFVLGFKIISSNVKPLTSSTKLSLVGIWLLSLLMIVFTFIENGLSFSKTASVSVEKVIPIKERDTLKIKMIGLNDFRLNRGDSKLVIINDEEKLYNSQLSIKIKPTDSEKIKLKVYKKASARSLRKAKKIAERIVYSFNSTSDELILDAYFLLGLKDKYRKQSVKIILEVPKGKILVLDNSIKNFLRYSSFVDDDVSFSNEKKLVAKVNQEGLNCLSCILNKNEIINANKNEKEGIITKDSTLILHKIKPEIFIIKADKSQLDSTNQDKKELKNKKRVIVNESGVHIN